MLANEASELIQEREIEGWCPIQQGTALFEVVKSLEPGKTIVELGSYKGLSTAWIGLGSEGGTTSRIVSVDLHDPTYSERKGGSEVTLSDNMKALGVDLDIVVGDSAEVASRADDYFIESGSVALLYIDACHEYESVRMDFWSWSHLLGDHAWVIFDDYTEDHPGVIKFVDDMVNRGVIEAGPVVGHAYFARLACLT